MSIRAIVKDGQIRLVDPLPPEWVEGSELTVEGRGATPSKAELDTWLTDVQQSVAAIPDEEHQRFLNGLAEVERASKIATRREWGLE